jgi:hypothetical protein
MQTLIEHIRGHLLRDEPWINHLLHEIKLGMPIIHQEPLPKSLADNFEPIPPTPGDEPAGNVLDLLMPLLAQEPPLCCQLLETLRSGRWLVTMHRKVKDSPPDDLLSESTMNDFPIAEVPAVMQGQCRAILADEARQVGSLEGQAANVKRWK